MWFTQTMGYIHKDEGIQPKRWRDTTYNKTVALPLHALIVSPTQSQRLFTIQNNTIHSHVTMLSFIGEIPWENTTVNPIPWVHITVGQHTSPKNSQGLHPRTPKKGEWLYSIPGVQTQLNNIFGYGISGSTTNNCFLSISHVIICR